ncbi:hypothetical protein ABIE89_003857 [Bradyrhizobium niftali]
MGINHILRLFSPYFLINQRPQQLGGHYQIPLLWNRLAVSRTPSMRYVVRLVMRGDGIPCLQR